MEEFDNIIKRNIAPQLMNIAKPLILTLIVSLVLLNWFSFFKYPLLLTLVYIFSISFLTRAINSDMKFKKYSLYLCSTVCFLFPFIHIHFFKELIHSLLLLIAVFTFIHFTFLAKNSVRFGLTWLIVAPFSIGIFSSFVLQTTDNSTLIIIFLFSICSWFYLANKGEITSMIYLFSSTAIISAFLYLISIIVVNYYSFTDLFSKLINKYSIPENIITENDLINLAQVFSGILFLSFTALSLVCLGIVLFRKRKLSRTE